MKAGFDPNQTRSADGTWGQQNNLKSFENRIKDNNFETAGVYNEDGELIFEKEGNINSVTFTDSELDLIKKEGYVFTHNHPTSKSFSKADISFLIGHDLKEMRAVGDDGVFSMKLLKNDAITDVKFVLQYEVSRKYSKIMTDNWFNSNDGTKDWVVDEANRMIVTKTWDHLSKSDFGKEYLDYQYIPNKDL